MTEGSTLKAVLLPKSLLQDPDKIGGQSKGDCLFGDLVTRGDRIVGLSAPTADAPRYMVMPPLTECHVHLDKCFTFSRLSYRGGDLGAAMDAQALDRDAWTPDDIRQRAGRAIEDLVSSGCRRVRSHVDWTHGPQATTPPMSWHVLVEIAAELRGLIDIQTAPLVSIDTLADPQTAEAIARICAATSGVLGAFVFGQAEQAEGIENAFHVARAHGLALDFHVDETLDPSFQGLELIADAALKYSLERPVLCGHACNLSTKSTDECARLIDKLARAGITLAVLPTTNLYLQGRAQGGASGRGLAPINTLRSAGVSVVLGTDNVEDAFFPLGRFDPRASLDLAMSAAHLDPPFGPYLPMISTASDLALGYHPSLIDQISLKDIFVYDVSSVATFITSRSAPMPLGDKLKGARV